ncbi:uncharacterized protein LOC130378498 isoform X1 [Gadus chalcogrammus]|uniref:uncharacterized protein LOC130378498 isoform X1 n=1 Tax=Gadus chalcogrammus TaxID=1042646 RepID=UPI0024C4665C|nr:uncharacterized protein LOC130378498 isoform X1 [Gadus chalcogrammus]
MERVRERVRRGGGGGGGRGGGGRGRRRRRRRQEGAQRGPNLTNEIHATLVDHVVNHGLTLREAGLRVQPNLSRYTVASVMRTFRLENRIEGQGRQGGRPPMFTEQQEREIVNMVLANNAITLKQLQADIVNNHAIFNDIHQVSTSTLARILKKKHIQMKQIYRVPFERNSERVNRLRHDYAERVLRMDGEEIQHEFIYVDEAGFNLTRTRRRGRNIIGHRAIVNVPGQRGGNITLCAAITQNGVLHRHAHMGAYNTALILLLRILGPIAQHNSSKSNKSYAIHCCLGQCVFPSLCSGSELVSATSTFHRLISSTILSIPQPYRRVFLGMAVEGI